LCPGRCRTPAGGAPEGGSRSVPERGSWQGSRNAGDVWKVAAAEEKNGNFGARNEKIASLLPWSVSRSRRGQKFPAAASRLTTRLPRGRHGRSLRSGGR